MPEKESSTDCDKIPRETGVLDPKKKKRKNLREKGGEKFWKGSLLAAEKKGTRTNGGK